jgi:hypothetical protein
MTTLRFLSNWEHEIEGELRAGEPLQIEYDPARLPTCRSERYGRPAWSIAGYVRFHPGADVQQVGLASGSAQLDVPADAGKLELWFNNTDQTGCVAWDSRHGANYWFDVVAPPALRPSARTRPNSQAAV